MHKLKIGSKFHFLIFYTFRELCRQKALWLGSVRSGPFIVLNDSASPKIIFLLIFFKRFRPFECRRGDHIWLLIGTSFTSRTRYIISYTYSYILYIYDIKRYIIIIVNTFVIECNQFKMVFKIVLKNLRKIWKWAVGILFFVIIFIYVIHVILFNQ